MQKLITESKDLKEDDLIELLRIHSSARSLDYVRPDLNRLAHLGLLTGQVTELELTDRAREFVERMMTWFNNSPDTLEEVQKERDRQVHELGYTPEMDDENSLNDWIGLITKRLDKLIGSQDKELREGLWCHIAAISVAALEAERRKPAPMPDDNSLAKMWEDIWHYNGTGGRDVQVLKDLRDKKIGIEAAWNLLFKANTEGGMTPSEKCLRAIVKFLDDNFLADNDMANSRGAVREILQGLTRGHEPKHVLKDLESFVEAASRTWTDH